MKSKLQSQLEEAYRLVCEGSKAFHDEEEETMNAVDAQIADENNPHRKPKHSKAFHDEEEDHEEMMDAIDHHIAHDSPKWQAIYDILSPFDIDNKIEIVDQIASLKD